MTAVPPAPPAGCPIAVAFCPAPPALLPAVAGRAALEPTGLGEACAEVVSAPLSLAPGVVVGAGGKDGVLALGDGSACRTDRAPASFDAAAAPFNAVPPAGRRAPAALHDEDAPFEVGYLVADRQLP